MKTIIINGQRELAELPELWYTDGTEEANEWALQIQPGALFPNNHIGNGNGYVTTHQEYWIIKGHTYITPSEFMRLVYQPWKEAQKVELPTTYKDLLDDLQLNGDKVYLTGGYSEAPHINACIRLTNIMNFANDAFDVDCSIWHVWSDGRVSCEIEPITNNPIFFTSKAAAEWAYKTFPEIFKAYWNV
jgi:hypothetical protein